MTQPHHSDRRSAIRTRGASSRTPSGTFLSSRYAGARFVLTNGELFRNPEYEAIQQICPTLEQHCTLQFPLSAMGLRNPPAHTRLRRLFARDFTATRVAGLGAAVTRLTRELLTAERATAKNSC